MENYRNQVQQVLVEKRHSIIRHSGPSSSHTVVKQRLRYALVYFNVLVGSCTVHALLHRPMCHFIQHC